MPQQTRPPTPSCDLCGGTNRPLIAPEGHGVVHQHPDLRLCIAALRLKLAELGELVTRDVIARIDEVVRGGHDVHPAPPLLERERDALRAALIRLIPHVRDPESAFAAGDDELEAIAQAERALRR